MDRAEELQEKAKVNEETLASLKKRIIAMNKKIFE